MKKTGLKIAGALIFTFTLLSVAFITDAFSHGRGYGYHMRDNYSQKTETIKGKIVSVEWFSPMMQAVKVKTAKETIYVHLAPQWYLDKKGIKLKVNDQIEVKGFKTNHWRETTLFATETKLNGKTLKLQDKEGYPAWSCWGENSNNRRYGYHGRGHMYGWR